MISEFGDLGELRGFQGFGVWEFGRVWEFRD